MRNYFRIIVWHKPVTLLLIYTFLSGQKEINILIKLGFYLSVITVVFECNICIRGDFSEVRKQYFRDQKGWNTKKLVRSTLFKGTTSGSSYLIVSEYLGFLASSSSAQPRYPFNSAEIRGFRSYMEWNTYS